jgi:transposase
MNEAKKSTVGIDISHLTFNAHCDGADYSYSNDYDGWQKLCKDTAGETFAMEATGNYYYKLAFYLHSKGFNVLVFNPYRVGCYIKSLGITTKTDKHDAKMMVRYSTQNEAWRYRWNPMPKKLERAKSIVSLLSSLKGIISASKNVQHACKLVVSKDDSLLGVMPKISGVLKEQQENLKKELAEIISDVYPDKFHNLQSIPGIASYSAAVLLVHGRGLECFASSRKFARFIGINPKVTQSGTSVKGSNSISKCGNPYVRSLLYMCSKAASLYCKPCIELKNRLLAKGKAKRLVRVAIMHRLVKIVFGVIQSGEAFRGGKMAA